VGAIGRAVKALWSPPVPHSIAERARGIDRWLGAFLLLALALLVLGWLAPMMTVEQLLFFERRVSVLSGMVSLIENGQIGLFVIMLLFSILFPVAKIYLSFRLLRDHDPAEPDFENYLRRVEALGKWSMLDVFIIALAVAAINISLIADVHLHWGIYALSGGVLLSMATFGRLMVIANRIRRGNYPAKKR
jgi:paraquat-inducible protein A